MSTENDIQTYLSDTIRLFSGPSIPSASIEHFISFENKFKPHQRPELAPQYEQLFGILRDRLVLPCYADARLTDILEELALIYMDSPAQLPKTDRADVICRNIAASLYRNEIYWQFCMLRIINLIDIFNNNNNRRQFIKSIFALPSPQCFKNMNDVTRTARLIKTLFPRAEELFTLLTDEVFTPELASKPVITQKAAVIWCVEILWNFVYKTSPEHNRLIPKWIDHLRLCMAKKNDEMVFYMHFPLSHLYLNNCTEQDEFAWFNKEVEHPVSQYFKRNAERWGLKPNKRKHESGRKKLAFLYERIVGSSPVKLLISLLYKLAETGEYDLYVYDMGYIEKAVSEKEYIDEIKAAGATYVNNHDLIDDADKLSFYSHMAKCMRLRERIIQDGIDTLVATGNRTQTSFLFSTRTAPNQVYWDHGNHEYDVAGIDRRICHFDDGYRGRFKQEFFRLSMLDKYLMPENDEAKTKAAEIKKSLPPHSVVLGSIGRIMKLSDEYLASVADILKSNPDAVYLACGAGPIEEKREKVQNLGVSDRFIFTDWVDAHVYGYVIDIYLNTFPLTGGESVNEFRAKGDNKYVVSIS